MTNVTIYFGKGDYTVNSLNIEKRTKSVKEYNEKGTWKFSLYDMGINCTKEKGAYKTPTFEKCVKELKEIKDPKVQELVKQLELVKERPSDKVVRISRKSPEEKEANRAKVAALLKDLPGIDPAMKERMLKAV